MDSAATAMRLIRDAPIGDDAPSARATRAMGSPHFISREEGWALRYPGRATFLAGGQTYRLIWRRSRWMRLDERPHMRTRAREVFAWILIGRRRIGALAFHEIDPDLVPNEEFFYAMDAWTMHVVELARVLCSEWEDFGDVVGGYGSVIHFEAAWMQPEYARGGIWAGAANVLMTELFPDRSILVLKAFPLEYEGAGPTSSKCASPFKRRQRAMIRHYRRLLGVRPLPGPPGKDGWLWARRPGLDSCIDPPTYCAQPHL
jgi:hypothetical protein